MDIAHSANREPPVEPSHEPDGGVPPVEAALAANAEASVAKQAAPDLPQNTKTEVEAAETFILSEKAELPVEEAETLIALDNAESASAEAAASDLPDAAEISAEETESLSAPDTAEPLAEATAILNATENAAPVARVPDVLAGNGPARRKNRYTPWLQIAAVVLLVCLVGGIVLAVRQPSGASGQTHQVPGTPTPVPPLKITAWCTANSAAVDPQLGQVSLSKVVAFAANDAWILGSTSKGNKFNVNTGRDFPLLEHWNGQTWSIVPTADTSALLKRLVNRIGGGKVSEAVALNDMTVLSDQNIWAVGSISVTQIASQSTWTVAPGVSVTTPGPTLKQVGQPLIEHWDGSTWQIVASPGGYNGPAGHLNSGNNLESISAVSANDIWAIGRQVGKLKPQSMDGSSFIISSGNAPLIEHWNGTSWTEQAAPASLQKGSMILSLGDIRAISNNDVWTFSTSINLVFSSYQPATTSSSGSTSSWAYAKVSQGTMTPYLYHWDGQNWNKMKLPGNLDKTAILKQVQVVADNDIWAIATTGVKSGKQVYDVNTLYHWDGNAWSSVAGANGADSKSNLGVFSVLAPDNIWLLGSTSAYQPFMQHWDGKTWNLVSPTSPAYGSAQSMAVAGQRAWALVDAYSTASVQKAPARSILDSTETVLETNC